MLDTGEVDALLTEDQGSIVGHPHVGGTTAPARVERVRLNATPGRRNERLFPFRCSSGRRLRGNRLRLFRDIPRRVVGHAQHRIRHVQVVPAPSEHEHATHASIFVQFTNAIDEGRDRLALLRHQPLHPPIPDHEVGRRRILIDEQQLRTRLERLHDRRGLTRRSRGVLRAEARRVLVEREPVDEARDVHTGNRTPILRAYLDRVEASDGALPSVSRSVVVDAGLQCTQ